jgi:glyoxylase-like metal-dependent hydrolase (beta-lactamase superfamily II)
VPDAEIHQISPRTWVWQRYDPAVKADLFSSALVTGFGLYLVDPIPLPLNHLRALRCEAEIAGIVITNANHARAAAQYSKSLSAPIFAHRDALAELDGSELRDINEGTVLRGDLEIIEIPGAALGEIAISAGDDGGTIIVGDALINFEPYGFTFLPGKYCQDEKQMRISLRKLLERPAERLVFAHGMPIVKGATARLRELLGK